MGPITTGISREVSVARQFSSGRDNSAALEPQRSGNFANGFNGLNFAGIISETHQQLSKETLDLNLL